MWFAAFALIAGFLQAALIMLRLTLIRFSWLIVFLPTIFETGFLAIMVWREMKKGDGE